MQAGVWKPLPHSGWQESSAAPPLQRLAGSRIRLRAAGLRSIASASADAARAAGLDDLRLSRGALLRLLLCYGEASVSRAGSRTSARRPIQQRARRPSRRLHSGETSCLSDRYRGRRSRCR
jgi:hypothetical protein